MILQGGNEQFEKTLHAPNLVKMFFLFKHQRHKDRPNFSKRLLNFLPIVFIYGVMANLHSSHPLILNYLVCFPLAWLINVELNCTFSHNEAGEISFDYTRYLEEIKFRRNTILVLVDFINFELKVDVFAQLCALSLKPVCSTIEQRIWTIEQRYILWIRLNPVLFNSFLQTLYWPGFK